MSLFLANLGMETWEGSALTFLGQRPTHSVLPSVFCAKSSFDLTSWVTVAFLRCFPFGKWD